MNREHEIAQLFRQHYRLLTYTAWKITGDQEQARDIASEAFARFLKWGGQNQLRTLKDSCSRP